MSGACHLARATERRSGRALSQWYGKVLRFPITRSLPHFPVSHPAGSPGAFRAGTIYCVPQMAPSFLSSFVPSCTLSVRSVIKISLTCQVETCPEGRVGGPMKTIDTLLPAFGLSWSLRHPVPTGTSLTGGVHRRSGEILVVLHNRDSMEILIDFGTASAASESIGSLCASSVCLSVDLVVV